MLSDVDVAAAGIRTVLCAFGILAIWQFALLPTLADEFRQRMFELRRELFCFMASGRLRADEPAYGYLRQVLNGLIGLAERVTLSRGLVLSMFLKTQATEHTRWLDKAIADVKDPKARVSLEAFRQELNRQITVHIMRAFPPLLLLAMVLALPTIGLPFGVSYARRVAQMFRRDRAVRAQPPAASAQTADRASPCEPAFVERRSTPRSDSLPPWEFKRRMVSRFAGRLPLAAIEAEARTFGGGLTA